MQVKQNSKLLAEKVSETLKLFVGAFCAEDSASALVSISRAKSLAGTGTELLSSIKRHQVRNFSSVNMSSNVINIHLYVG